MSDNLHGQPPMPPPFQAIIPSSPLKAIAAVHPIPVAAGADVVAVGWRAHAAAQPRVLGHLRMAGVRAIGSGVHTCNCVGTAVSAGCAFSMMYQNQLCWP